MSLLRRAILRLVAGPENSHQAVSSGGVRERIAESVPAGKQEPGRFAPHQTQFLSFPLHLGLEFVALGRSAGRCRVGCSRGGCDEPLQSNRQIRFLRSAGFSG